MAVSPRAHSRRMGSPTAGRTCRSKKFSVLMAQSTASARAVRESLSGERSGMPWPVPGLQLRPPQVPLGLAGEDPSHVVEPGEARVGSLSLPETVVDLLHDDGGLEEPEAVVEIQVVGG